MTSMKLNAYAKVNIGLDVVRRLDNGYHELRTIMQTIGLHDTLYMERCEEPGIFLVTDSEVLGKAEDNLAYRAAKLLFDEFSLEGGVRIRLEKRIPVAAGMAGGSTDAAAVFRGMNVLYELHLSSAELMQRGVLLGADIPYCIVGGTYLAEGIGEVLQPLAAMPDCYLLIAKPPIGVSTKWVYENLHAEKLEKHPDIDGMIQAMEASDLEKLGAKMGNVLEDVTVSGYPVVRTVIEQMEQTGACRAMMSGSGPTVFGIYKTKEQCHSAYEKLKLCDDIAFLCETGCQPAYEGLQ